MELHTKKTRKTQKHAHINTFCPQFILFIRRPGRVTSMRTRHYHACNVIQDNTFKIAEVLVSSLFHFSQKKSFVFIMNFWNSLRVSLKLCTVDMSHTLFLTSMFQYRDEAEQQSIQAPRNALNTIQFTTFIVPPTFFSSGVTFLGSNRTKEYKPNTLVYTKVFGLNSPLRMSPQCRNM